MSPQGIATGYVWLPEIEPAGDWIQQAACRDIDPELWFPRRGDSHTATQAKAVCNTCPVQTDCLDYAIRWRIQHGIWGGQSERGRRLLRDKQQHLRQRRPPPGHGDPGRYRYGCRCETCREAHRAETAGYRQAAKERQP